MRKKIGHGIFLLLIFVATKTYGQKAEYNKGNNYLYPGGQKFIGMDFFNSDNGIMMNNGTMWYSGNFHNDGIVGFDNSLIINPAINYFASDSLQHISGNGTTRFYNLTFGSQLTPVAYSLEQNISVAHQVNFSKGIVLAQQTTPETMVNMLLLEDNVTCLNASDASHVDGFVSKTGNKAFTFPIGNKGFYRPVSISAPDKTDDCFSARYMYMNPENAGYSLNKKVSTLANISNKEYWIVNHTHGTSNGKITLSWDVTKTSAPVPDNLDALVVARWDGEKWVNEGSISSTGNSNTGTITANVTGYGVFTLGSATTNPQVVVKDNITTYEDTDLNGTLLSNDAVHNSDILSLNSFSISGVTYQPGATAIIPNAGTITIEANGTFAYSATLNYNGILPTINYTVRKSDNSSESRELIINVLPLPELGKQASKPQMNNDGTFSWVYILTLLNDTPTKIDNVQVEDNLDEVFGNKNCSYTVTSIYATGNLTANGLYNGSGNIMTLIDGSSLISGQMDSIRMELKVDTNNQLDSISVFNQAILKSKTSFGEISVKSQADLASAKPDPTQTVIPPASQIILPDGFSPNNDGINDKLVIGHPVTSKMDIEIYSRSGNLVYKSTDYANDWDGKGVENFLGLDVVDGTYYCAYKEIKISTGQIIAKGVKFITIRR